MGLRRLLSRQPAEHPLERVVELGRTEGPLAAPTPVRPFADEATRDVAAPISVTPVVKKAAVVVMGEKSGPADGRNFDVWRRGQSNSIVGLFDRRF